MQVVAVVELARGLVVHLFLKMVEQEDQVVVETEEMLLIQILYLQL